MADFWTKERLAQAIERAEGGTDIAAALSHMPEPRRQRLRQRALELAPLIVEATANLNANLAKQQQQLQEELKQIELVTAERHPFFAGLEKFTDFAIGILMLIALGGLGMAVTGNFGYAMAWLKRPAVWYVLVPLLTLLGVAIFVSMRERSRHLARTVSLRESRMLAGNIQGTRDRLAAMQADVEAVGMEAAGRAWRRALAEFVEPSYDMSFAARETPGLTTAFNPHLVVETPARDRLLDFIAQLRGANIGIAGPRGAGKSTLMQSVCGPHVREIGTQKVLPVLTSAPVEYQARDFLLHLFATLCHQVIERLGGAEATEQTAPTPQWAKPLQASLDLYRVCFITGLALLPIGLIVLLTSVASAEHTVETAKAASAASGVAAASAPVAASAASTAGSAVASKGVNSGGPASRASGAMQASAAKGTVATSSASWSQTRSASHPATRPAAPPASSSSAAQPAASSPKPAAANADDISVFDVLAALGLTAGTLFTVSLVMLCAAALMLTAVGLKILRQLREGLVVLEPLQASANPFFTVLSMRWLTRLYKPLRPPRPEPEDPLVARARARLQEIKFQQSWTDGWSGALKLLFALEGSVNQARSIAQQQLTLPEIADGFCKFVERVAKRFTVIVGIDELDKMESDEKAQRFLNDIKVVFGVPDVFFLVSVSQDAMSQFERRGLPFRDAFDSAFDEVISVQHLEFASARLMLNERVIGLPLPFQALCWVMSGGLAREVVRTARDLAEHLPRNPQAAPATLSDVADKLVRQHLAGKARAVSHAAERCVASEGSVELLRQIDLLTSPPLLCPQTLIDAERQLRSLTQAPRRRREAMADPDDQTVRKLAMEFSAYVFFLAGVLDFFDAARLNRTTLDAALQGSAAQPGWLILLPSALRLIAVHPELAKSRVRTFFDRCGSAGQYVFD